MINSNMQRTVFFDLDGTLHQQNMFSCFLRYLLTSLPLNIMLVILVLPIVGFGLLIRGYSACWPISLLLWSITFCRSEMKLQILQSNFVNNFRQQLRSFPLVRAHLDIYIANDMQVWLITGSPEILVRKVYHDALFFSQVKLIGSHIQRRYGGWMLTMRCLGHEKVIQLERKLGTPLKLYSGYSNSLCDSPLLYFCKYRWFVTYDGQLKLLD